MMVYVALLRGINVGGNNLIKMDALRAAFEVLGFTDVKTYIASGNVVFNGQGAKAELTKKLENHLKKTFAYEAKLVVISSKDLALAVAEAPKGFGSAPAKYNYDVIFVKAPLTTKAARKDIEIAEGVDDVAIGKHALYFRRLIAQKTRSRLSKIVGKKALYASITIRNWNTTTKLLALASAAG